MRTTLTYTDVLGATEWQALLEERAAPAISCFLTIQPTNVKGHDEPLRLRRLLDQVETQLAEQGLGAAKIETLLAPARALAKDDLTFWQEQRVGVAIFLAPSFFRTFRLPLPLAEKVVVGQHFWLRPLLPLLSGDGEFYLLTLSQNHVRLFRADRFRQQEIPLPHIPNSLAEATQSDEGQLVRQLHSIASPGGARQGHRAVAFHGHGSASDMKVGKESLHHFLQAVDRGVCAQLANTSAPLLLAGTQSICGIYREVNRYPQLFPKILPGNPDRVHWDTLHQRGWALVEPIFSQPHTQALLHYQQWTGSHDPRAVHDLLGVVLAAANQRIETLFVTPTHEAWGYFEAASNTVVIEQQPRPDNEELINLAVIHTLRNRGQVYEIEAYMLGESRGVAALLRY